MKIKRTGAILAASAAVLLATAGCQSTGTADSGKATAKVRSGCSKDGCNQAGHRGKKHTAKDKASCKAEAANA